MQYIILILILAMIKALDVVNEMHAGIEMYIIIVLSTVTILLSIYFLLKYVIRQIDKRIELGRYIKREAE